MLSSRAALHFCSDPSFLLETIIVFYEGNRRGDKEKIPAMQSLDASGRRQEEINPKNIECYADKMLKR